MTPVPSSAAPEQRYLRLGWLVVLVGVGGFLLWAALAPLDKGVPVTGTVITDGNRKSVQHLNGGIVERILVKDGDIVKAGQLLVQLDASQIHNNIQALKESSAGLDALIRGLQESQQTKRRQVALLNEQLKGLRELANEGYVARNRVLEVERQAVQIEGAIFEDTGNIGKYRKQIAESNERMASYQFDLDNTRIKAPVDGVVQGLAVFTVRGVVTPGMKLLDLVPADQPLMVDAQVPPHLIDKLGPGLVVEVSFTAFNQNVTPKVEAVVAMVSPDRLVEERSGAPYFKLQAQVTPSGMARLAGLQIRPGMPVDVFVKTGERSLLSYLFKPLLDRLGHAFAQE